MSRDAFLIDLDRCIGCQACTVACKIGNERPLGGNYIVVRDIVTGQMPDLFGTFAHHRCWHCADAGCVAVCPTEALHKTANGLTAVDIEKCVGCGYCRDACPFDVPKIVNGDVSKCVGCVEVVNEGGEPYCVQTCPSQAISFGDRDKLLADAQAKIAVLKPRYPNAQVYGDTQLGGLGLMMILLDKPGLYGLQERPIVPSPLYAWQRLHPMTLPLIGLSMLFTGVSFVIARREHAREKAAMRARLSAAAAAPAAQAEAVPVPPAAKIMEEPHVPAAPVVHVPAAPVVDEGIEAPPMAQSGDVETADVLPPEQTEGVAMPPEASPVETLASSKEEEQ